MKGFYGLLVLRVDGRFLVRELLDIRCLSLLQHADLVLVEGFRPSIVIPCIHILLSIFVFVESFGSTFVISCIHSFIFIQLSRVCMSRLAYRSKCL